MTIMENRIKRLMYEEDRARRLQNLAKYKADKMLEARDRHQKVSFCPLDFTKLTLANNGTRIEIDQIVFNYLQDLEDKFKNYDERVNNLMQQKARNTFEKQQRVENIQKIKDEVYQKHIKNKEEIQQVRHVLIEQKEKQKIDDHSLKKTKKLGIL